MGNSSSVFGTAKPISISMVDLQTDQENQDLKFRAEQREIDKIAQDRKDKADAKKEALQKEMLAKLPQNYDSGSKSLTELQGKIINQGVERIGEITKKLSDPKISDDEKISLRIEAQQLNQLPENLKIATDTFTKKIETYKKGVADGSLFEDPVFEKQVLSGFENYVGGLDGGLPVVGFVDKNADGKVDKLDVVDYNDIQSGIPQFDFQPKVDLDKIVTVIAKDVGMDDITTDSNFTSTQVKQANSAKVDAAVKGILYDDQGMPTPAAKSQLKKMGLDNTPENLKKVDTYTKELLLSKTDYLKKTDKDYGSMNAAARLKFDKDKEKPKEDTTFAQVETPPVYAAAKVTPSAGYRTVSVTGAKPISILKGFVDGKEVSYTNATINSYTVEVNKKGERTVVAEVVYGETKGGKTNEIDPVTGKVIESTTTDKQNQTALVRLNEKDGYKYAKSMGLENFNQLKNQAKSAEQNKKFNAVQESAISKAMKDNPGYSREEIIQGLGL